MQVDKKQSPVSETIYSYLRQDIRGTQIFLYGVAGVGLLVALRRVRPFARFTKPSEIPDRFLISQVRISGNVVRIEPSGAGPLLMVETKPLVPLPRFGRSKQLPIKIANVNVTANGTSWLQSVVAGQRIVFVPLVKNKDCVESRISLVEPNEGSLEIGRELVRLGFGMVCKPDATTGVSKDKRTLMYCDSLAAAQKWAERQRNGHWHFAIKPTIFWKLRNAIDAKAKSVLPAFFARQLNI